MGKVALYKGTSLISKERVEQIHKHNYDAEHDKQYVNKELIQAALFCITRQKSLWPRSWNNDQRDRILEKTELERYAIAGAFLAAEIDRQMNEKKDED